MLCTLVIYSVKMKYFSFMFLPILMVYLNICVVFKVKQCIEIVTLQRHNNSVPVSTFMCLWAIYRSVCLFCCSKIRGPTLVIYMNRSQTHECGNWDWCRAIPFLEYINGIFVAVYFCNIWALSKNKFYYSKIKYYAGRPKS